MDSKTIDANLQIASNLFLPLDPSLKVNGTSLSPALCYRNCLSSEFLSISLFLSHLIFIEHVCLVTYHVRGIIGIEMNKVYVLIPMEAAFYWAWQAHKCMSGEGGMWTISHIGWHFHYLDRHEGIFHVKSKQDKNVPENKERSKGTEAVAITLCLRTRSSQMGPTR